MSKNMKNAEIHVKIPRDILYEMTKRAEQRNTSRSAILEESLREHLMRINLLEHEVSIREKKISDLRNRIASQPSIDMIQSFVIDLLDNSQVNDLRLGWEFERVARFFLRALNRFGHIYIPIETWKKIKEGLPPSRRNPFSQLTDYEKLCRALYNDPYYFERCIQNNEDIYLVKAEK